MVVLKNVAIVGATGNIGAPILSALLANPDITTKILARNESSILKNPPAKVDIQTVDFASVDSIASALAGVDALICTSNGGGLAIQENLVNGAIQAGVKRFIPSEFGCDLDNQRIKTLAVFAEKIQFRKVLEEKASKGEIEWTGISNGAFLDWGLKVGFLGLDIPSKTAKLFDGGEQYFAATLTSDVAKAVIGILEHPEETKNKPVLIQSIRLTAKKLLATAEKLTGTKFETTTPSTAETEKAGNEKIAKGDFSGYYDLIYRGLWGEGYGSDFEGRDSSALLGITPLSEAGLEELVKGFL